jgi:hypothetical protein
LQNDNGNKKNKNIYKGIVSLCLCWKLILKN